MFQSGTTKPGKQKCNFKFDCLEIRLIEIANEKDF